MANAVWNNTIKKKFSHLNISGNYAIVLAARKGVKTKIFYDLAEIIKMPEKKLAETINLSARTVSNYKDKGKTLEPLFSEHLLKLIFLYEKGEEVFGNIDEFNYWLNKPLWNTGQKPVDWLITSGGVDLVIEEIDKLAEGYPV